MLNIVLLNMCVHVHVCIVCVCVSPGCYRLQKLVDDIYERFVSSGLMHREYSHIKLHATLINSIKRQDDDLPELLVVKKRPRISFDAHPIMQVSVMFCRL